MTNKIPAEITEEAQSVKTMLLARQYEEKEEADVAILIPGNTFSSTFLACFINTIMALQQAGKTFYWKNAHSSILPALRNQLVGSCPQTEYISHLPFGFDNVKPKKVLFLDSDMAWNHEDVIKMLDSEEPVITGWYVRSDGMPVVMRQKEGMAEGFHEIITKEEIEKHEGLMEVTSAGLGLFVTTYEVMEKIGYPWFKFSDLDGFEDGEYFPVCSGEDVWFCKRIREEGFKVMMDPKIKAGHEKPQVLG